MFIAHRINNIAQLKNVPNYIGVELDLRDSIKGLIISHDPFIDGEFFEEYLMEFRHKFIIVNIKSEGIEIEAKKLLDKYRIENYFFLDSTIPMIVKLGKLPGYNFAVRVSVYESILSAISLKLFAKWIWVDCFNDVLLTKEELVSLKNHGFKLCFVSPELHNINAGIDEYINKFSIFDIKPEMVCSKLINFKLWHETLIE
jgi:hypothetical protein